MMTPVGTAFGQAAQKVLRAVAQQPQRQDGTSAQLADLRPFAVRLGVPVTPYLPHHPEHELSPQLAALLRGLPALSPQNDLAAGQALLLLRALANRLGLYDAADVLRVGQKHGNPYA